MQPKMDSDAALIEAYRERGDQKAFTELVHRHRENVFRLAVSILGTGFTAEAEEVTQEVFVRMYHGLSTFRGESQFSSWIYRIAFNLAVNLKKHVRYQVPHINEEVLASRASSEVDPLSRLESVQCSQELMAAVDELPDVYQSALRLHYWTEASIAEIADLLGIPENTVKSYLHRARQLLRSMLEKGANA
jgi:RNA polymerase sigma-70 factor, ECF subfamily